MTDFKKRSNTTHILLRFFTMSVATLALFLVSVVAVRAAWNMYGTFKVAAELRGSAEGQLTALKSDEARVAAAVASFDTPQGIEKELRERFGVVKPGEGEIQIVREGGEALFESEDENFFSNILRSLFVW